MNTLEIDQSLEEIEAYLGAEVQSIGFTRGTLVVGLFHGLTSQVAHLILWAKPPKSALVLTEEPLKKIKSETKPLYLFAKAHLLGAKLVAVKRDQELGRVVHLDFVGGHDQGLSTDIRLEQNLVPVAWNISLTVGSKSVFLNKPKELVVQPSQGDVNAQMSSQLERIKNETLSALWGVKTEKVKDLKVPPLSQEVAKKQKLLQKLKADERDKRNLHYDQFAELVVGDPKQAALEFPHFYDGSQNVYVQQKDAYEKHKKNQQKIERLLERQHEVQSELQTLQDLSPAEWTKLYQQKQSQRLQTSKTSKQKSSNIEARKLEVSADSVVYLGKSAQDNLRLLRQAKAWHYWVHIKDRSSAYALLQCPKDKKITYDEIVRIVRWWHEASASFAKSFQEGDKVSILVTQCRYVRPIKGDKLGRVTYSHEQVFTISL
ncbi:MAG: hypothetical protein M9899_04040 [Bdellovibrionaceae bacterium]|nr:hypothetical protein [Pseudobdellovibrionaceae bacterium]